MTRGHDERDSLDDLEALGRDDPDLHRPDAVVKGLHSTPDPRSSLLFGLPPLLPRLRGGTTGTSLLVQRRENPDAPLNRALVVDRRESRDVRRDGGSGARSAAQEKSDHGRGRERGRRTDGSPRTRARDDERLIWCRRPADSDTHNPFHPTLFSRVLPTPLRTSHCANFIGPRAGPCARRGADTSVDGRHV